MTTTKICAGLLMYRVVGADIKVLLVHPGGPFFANKDEGSWSIPKGEIEHDEELLDAALREFQEETGFVPSGPYFPLATIKQKNHKIVHVWTFEGNCDPKKLVSNTFELEWPPKSGRMQKFPEIDKAECFDLETAKKKINPAQIELLEALSKRLLKG